MMPEKFYVSWEQIDPELRDGGIAGELAPFFVAPDLGDNSQTLNQDLRQVFYAVNRMASSISIAPESMSEAQPGKRIIEECLMAINDFFEKVVDRTHTDASRFFEWSHPIPPRDQFPMFPIRFPLRNPLINSFVHYCIGTLVEIAENNRNALHAGLDPQGADKVIAGLYNWKANLLKHNFDLEVAGEISRSEMIDLYSGKYRPGPTVSPPDDSAELPGAGDVAAALSGVDVMQWYPSEVEWSKFGELNMSRYVPERVLQPEGAYPATEDVAHEQPVGADGAPIIGRNDGQP